MEFMFQILHVLVGTRDAAFLKEVEEETQINKLIKLLKVQNKLAASIELCGCRVQNVGL